MRYLAAVLMLSLFASAQDKSPRTCVVIKPHVKKASEALFRWTQPKPYEFIEGDYPAGMKFHYEIGDKTIREIQQKNGKAVIVKPDYQLPDIEDARKTCKAWLEAK